MSYSALLAHRSSYDQIPEVNNVHWLQFEIHDTTTTTTTGKVLKTETCSWHAYIYIYTGVPGGKVNILGGHSIGHSKQKCLNVRFLF